MTLQRILDNLILFLLVKYNPVQKLFNKIYSFLQGN